MNELQVFTNSKFGDVRVITKNRQPWFVATDICKALDLTNATVSLQRLDDDERSKFNLGRQGEANVVNEYGLYSLILCSRKPEAKEFKRWITHEVLPQIRQTGGYIPISENDSDEDILAKALLIAKNKIELKNKIIADRERRLAEQKPKVIFADSVTASRASILVGELAKIIKQNGHDMGQNRLFEWLRNNGYLINRKGTDYNMPTQKSMELGLFEIKETSITHSDGHISVSKTPKVTGKGQVYFVNKFQEKVN